jgi:hypothetical protein
MGPRTAAAQPARSGVKMINYEEELKKFHPSMDVNEAEDAIYSRDLTDVTDILREMIRDDKENRKK